MCGRRLRFAAFVLAELQLLYVVAPVSTANLAIEGLQKYPEKNW